MNLGQVDGTTNMRPASTASQIAKTSTSQVDALATLS
jgi:hypothetical protein